MAKPSAAELTAAMAGVLANQALANLTHSHDTFEVYVVDLVAQAASREGASVKVVTPVGKVATPPYTFRSAPGRIATTGTEPVHLELEFPSGDILEVHQGIYVTGRTIQRHECDVAVLTRDEADAARAANAHPRSAGLVFAAECKLYKSRIGIATAREYAGLDRDFSPQSMTRRFVTNHRAELVRQYLSRLNLFYADEIHPGSPRVDEVVVEIQHLLRRYLDRGRP